MVIIRYFFAIFELMNEFGIIEYNSIDDIVRSNFIKSFYKALYKVENVTI